jgi:hypothetical protein
MNRILTATAAGLAGLMMMTGPALADRDNDRWRDHDGKGRYERHDRDHDRDRDHRRYGSHRDHDRDWDRRWDRGRHDRRHAHRDHGYGHDKDRWRYRHDGRFWTEYDRWYRSEGRRHHRHGWDRRDSRLVIIFEQWLDGRYRHGHYRDDRGITGGVYLNFPLRIGY